MGSSPRVRSRRPQVGPYTLQPRIISACAEQTGRVRLPGWRRWDHLRVCGADEYNRGEGDWETGSSPRVRSRRAGESPFDVLGRIISACAEQTNTIAARAIGRRDHLRVCGADARESRRLMCWAGSSPRVRSRRLAYHGAKIRIGIISACAEQTFQTAAVRRDRRDHLRVCGADCSAMSANHVPLGSSPRVRSRPATLHSEVAYHGIISACAEQTYRPLCVTS